MSEHSWRRTFTATDIAIILGVHHKTVLHWRKIGVLKGYSREHLREFLRTYTNWRGRLP